MKKLAKITLYFVTCFLLTDLFFVLSLDYVVPPLKYDNTIQFDIAYLNQDEKLIVFFKEKNARMHDAQAIEIEASHQLNHISLRVPYVYNPTFYLMFGEAKSVIFALSNLNVNGNAIENAKIRQELEIIGYNVIIKDNIVYAEPKKNATLGYLDLYQLSNSFINIDLTELEKYQSDDTKLRFLYFLIIFFVNFLLLKIFTYKFSRLMSDGWLLIYSITLHIILLLIAIIEPLIDISTLKLFDICVILKNNLFVILLPCFILALSSKFKLLKLLLVPSVLLFMIFVGIDHFAQVVFGSRFFWETTGKFAGSLIDGLPFLVSYFTTIPGSFYILSILIFIVSCIFIKKLTINKSFFTVLSVLVLLSFFGLFVWNKSHFSKYYNVVQVNVNGLFTDGDYKRPYSKFKRKNIQDLSYQTYEGLNQRKNVILILVESLACDVTFLCGSSYNYSPYIKQLATENIWFPNYYTNNFHTNGAIFTITTGLPLINSSHGEETFFNNTFYKYDLINSFKGEGYVTAYYTPASPVLNKKKQLDVSDYSYISTVNDDYYANSEKKGVFNSVSDEEMFSKIFKDLQDNKSNPKFFMLTTISTHTPFITPWGARNIKQAYAYTDYVLKKFIENLNSIDYFKNGIVVITGDHRGWGKNSKNNSSIESQRLPLIVIDGQSHGIVKNDVSFSHSSIGVMLKYLMLSKYEKNKYQINPLIDSEKNEFIFNYDAAKVNSVLIKYGNKEDEILLDGDQTRFLGNSFDEKEKKNILDFLSFLRP